METFPASDPPAWTSGGARDRASSPLEAAPTFRPMTNVQVNALLSRTVKAASHGEFELFKPSSIFDSPTAHPGWLGHEPQRLRRLMPE